MCCTVWIKHEGICSEKSGLCDEIFEGSVTVSLVGENILVEYIIIGGIFEFTPFIVHFL